MTLHTQYGRSIKHAISASLDDSFGELSFTKSCECLAIQVRLFYLSIFKKRT